MNRRRAAAALAAVALCGLLLSLLIPKYGTTPPAASCDSAAVVSAWLIEKGFDENSFKISLKGFKTQQGSESRSAGSDAFMSTPVLTLEELNKLLDAQSGNAGKAAKIINDRLDGRKATPVAVMFLEPVNIEGNLGVNSDSVVNLGTRKSAKYDVVWVFVDQANCQVIDNLVVRAGCGNPGEDVVPPQPPGPPPPPPPPPPPGPGPSETPTPTPTGSTQTPTPTPTPCPQGQNVNVNGVCVEPKPTNPSAYPHPSGKPVVPPVTTPPEATPPVVATQAPGGNGVIDSPTKIPGSQSGVTAPGAIPAPTSPPASTPPNEGGSNSGGVPGF